MLVGVFARWLINAFVNRSTKVLKEATKDTWVDNVYNETGMQVKGRLFHGCLVFQTGGRHAVHDLSLEYQEDDHERK